MSSYTKVGRLGDMGVGGGIGNGMQGEETRCWKYLR